MKMGDAAGVELVNELIRRTSLPAASGVRILADQVRVDESDVQARRSAVIFPWEAPGLPVGAVQCDLVFGERLPVEPVDVNVSDGAGGVVSLHGDAEVVPGVEAALAGDGFVPAGQELYDATLLAERTTLSPDLLRKVFANADCASSLPTSDDFPLQWRVDWNTFRTEYPHVPGQATDWQERLAAALRRCRSASQAPRCQTPAAVSSDVAEKTMSVFPQHQFAE